jgi:hypothetical protein
MTDEEILEGNKLIAEFIGWKEYQDSLNSNKGRIVMEFPGKKSVFLDMMKYHSSWDWLMPVVEKIEKNGAIVEMWGSLGWNCRIWVMENGEKKVNLLDGDKETLIEAAFPVVVEFIKWYNQNGK